MSWQATVWVLEHSESRLGDRCVLLSIANHCNREGSDSHPSLGTIAHEARVSVRNAQRSVPKAGSHRRAGSECRHRS
jgi:hypothetical protein